MRVHENLKTTKPREGAVDARGPTALRFTVPVLKEAKQIFSS